MKTNQKTLTTGNTVNLLTKKCLNKAGKTFNIIPLLMKMVIIIIIIIIVIITKIIITIIPNQLLAMHLEQNKS